MNTLLRWVSPLVFAIIATAGIRLVTDISSSYPFWNRPVYINLKDFLNTVVGAYLLDFLFRYLVKSRYRQEKRWKVFGEYAILTVFLLLALTVSTAIAHYFIDSPNYLIDFIIVYVVIIPLALFYYTMLRNSEIRKEYLRQTLQFEKVKSEQLTAELNFLKAQYHPHFLFNALNTVYFQVDEENKMAKQTIELLSDLLRYQLYDIKNEVAIKEEIHFLNTYIEFQKLRMSDRLKLTTCIDPLLGEQKIHPLLFQPLLENAFKYVGGEYWIHILLELDTNEIRFVVENALDRHHHQTKKSGIGIENLKRRLAILYPGRHDLIAERRNDLFHAELIILLNEAV